MVSIVMCVYNGEKFLAEQITSVLGQTYGHFELLCLDDRSTDNSHQVLESFQLKDARIKVFKNEVNLGYNKNFELGIAKCKGDFISICDQDDIWVPTKLEELVTNLGNSLLIFSNSELIDEQGQKLPGDLEKCLKLVDNPGYKAFLENNFVTGHTMLFRAELRKSILPFPDNLHFYDWWIGFAASYLGNAKYLNKVLTQYRVHTTSVVQQTKKSLNTRATANARKYTQTQAFAKATFLAEPDRQFIEEYLTTKKQAPANFINYLKCFVFLLKNQKELFPWYKKGMLSKINYLRKQCV